jgi:hypothetical protein
MLFAKFRDIQFREFYSVLKSQVVETVDVNDRSRQNIERIVAGPKPVHQCRRRVISVISYGMILPPAIT